MRRLLFVVGLLAVVGFGRYWVLTAPSTWAAIYPTRDGADDAKPDLVNGRAMFLAGGRGTCHAPPGQQEATRPSGGLALVSGSFYVPNISPDPIDGIGDWNTKQSTQSIREGVSGGGHDEYPTFPYTSLQRMSADDPRDLFGSIKALPTIVGKAGDNDLEFPFTGRSGVGLWKLLFLDGQPRVADAKKGAAWNRGRYWVEGPACCAERQSPRDVLGAIVADKRFSGAPDPEGNGYVPNVTADDTGIGYGSRREIADYLGDAVSPISIPAGGSMAAIIADMPMFDDRPAMAQSITRIAGTDTPNAGAPETNLTALVKMLPLGSNVAKSPSNALAQSADALSHASVVYTVATKSLFLDRASVSSAGSGDGRILPAVRLTVLARDGDWLRVRIDGWQLQGSEAAFEALEGQRILVAALSRAAIAKVASQPGVVDAATKLTWFQGALTAWVSTESLTTDLDKIWKYDVALYAASCGTCHVPRPVDGYTSDRWLTDLGRMRRYTDLRDDQYRLLEVYLQYHSKDVGPLRAGGEP
jgi:mono/diheme cytochrome c family protein